ncbi:SAM-dependent methyltransferase [Nocardia cyriacigeorgica]|uniref:SAM-dependent methyltransferase n=1 Tax=Nocardia cyriacigeorgica TaxID=135487 RepID=A0A6P1D7S4_9NOCA|nr:SAM-dependent methyltransferase [Nocardia cyriacigeorgica]NEW39905.1 SAM-dependent methyltransferase [Nocardia cyriacigeorgica]NEW45659.1 SAM-dependent methyltransferase [Nocardia cyriacigeorgica]NEW51388.1 SAM-dependent methyltransferase [Nocardia cyriacigeorgica]NEW55376.1 SAM-dependent methyltransferase [Nocardia cyriacigeorgica]
MNDIAGVVDPNTPSIARVYDYLLGGKDNYPVDQEIGDHFKINLPGSVAIAFGNRQALVRGVRDIARSGVEQFIDLGSGLPTADNVHQIAARYTDSAKVVYVDNDPIVLAHGRALLATDKNTTVVQADVREPERIRDNDEVARLIDFDEPVAIVFSAILHHLNDDEDPIGVVSYWRDQIPSGSQVFISHFRSGGNAETEAAEQKLQSTFGRGRWRTDDEIRALFAGLEILEPGIVPAVTWRPDAPGASDTSISTIGTPERELTVWDQLISAGLARKP